MTPRERALVEALRKIAWHPTASMFHGGCTECCMIHTARNVLKSTKIGMGKRRECGNGN